MPLKGALLLLNCNITQHFCSGESILKKSKIFQIASFESIVIAFKKKIHLSSCDDNHFVVF